MPSLDVQRHRVVQRALRNARRYWRVTDTAGEILERWLDRQIKRKTATTRIQANAMVPLWERYRDNVKVLEQALADLLAIVTNPGGGV